MPGSVGTCHWHSQQHTVPAGAKGERQRVRVRVGVRSRIARPYITPLVELYREGQQHNRYEVEE
ncbi:hypothetical protein Pmani_038322 [Petrolisthes manimaculis]|uniref:Uncharacterized protein n=1 Tax=Petrolisthes manimaculis TaxID=1843537 RepID=A0AAE1NFZ7_9EUCA|nr:hypothetical protein Pmani_038322 [Petrolisthes manimaculis]